MKLSEMTPEQLRAKRAKIDRILLKKSSVKLDSVEFDPGDDRTTGYFELTAQTPLGELEGRGSVNGDFGEEQWWLGGEELAEGVEWPPIAWPQAAESGVGTFLDRRDILIVEALEEWCATLATLSASGRKLTKK